MSKEVIMPALGMAQDTGILLQWLKSEGESVQEGEPLMEVETDKATVEVEAPATGVLMQITAQAGDEIPVGQTIALILSPEDAVSAKMASSSSLKSEAAKTRPATRPTSSQLTTPSSTKASPVAARIAAAHQVDLGRVPTSGERIRKADVMAYLATQADDPPSSNKILASPKARRLAQEHQLALSTISGQGPDGAILATDVLNTIASLNTTPEPISLTPTPVTQINRTWQIMAQRLTESWHTVPHFYLVREAKASQLKRWREEAQKRIADKITYTDLFVKLVALALRKHPRLNAKWEENTIIPNHEINIGLAVATEEGVLVPVVHQTEQLGLQEIAARRSQLVTQAQAGKLPLNDRQGGTFTISNLGMYEVDAFNAIVNPPQAAILALGRIADQVVPLKGVPAVQPMMTLTLSCDHRVVDGARGAEFLQTLVGFIEEPLGVLD